MLPLVEGGGCPAGTEEVEAVMLDGKCVEGKGLLFEAIR